MLKPEDFAIGDHVAWSVYGQTYTGIVERIFTETGKYHCNGDMLVRCDSDKNRVVPVIPELGANKCPGSPFPYDEAQYNSIVARRRSEIERFNQENP